MGAFNDAGEFLRDFDALWEEETSRQPKTGTSRTKIEHAASATVAKSAKRPINLYTYDARKEADAYAEITIIYWSNRQFVGRTHNKVPATTTSEVKFQGEDRPRKFVVRGGWAKYKMQALLSACGLHGVPFSFVSGTKLQKNEPAVIERGKVQNFATMSDTGWIDMHSTPQPLPENTELFRKKMIDWHGEPKMVKPKKAKKPKDRPCAYPGCEESLSHKHVNARFCDQHKRDMDNFKRKRRHELAKEKAQAVEPKLEEGEKLPWEE